MDSLKQFQDFLGHQLDVLIKFFLKEKIIHTYH